MSTRIKLPAVLLLLFLIAGSAHARMKLRVEKEAMAVSSPTPGAAAAIRKEYQSTFLVKNMTADRMMNKPTVPTNNE